MLKASFPSTVICKNDLFSDCRTTSVCVSTIQIHSMHSSIMLRSSFPSLSQIPSMTFGLSSKWQLLHCMQANHHKSLETIHLFIDWVSKATTVKLCTLASFFSLLANRFKWTNVHHLFSISINLSIQWWILRSAKGKTKRSSRLLRVKPLPHVFSFRRIFRPEY